MSLFFSFNDPATTKIYTLSLHDALPISPHLQPNSGNPGVFLGLAANRHTAWGGAWLSALFSAETASRSEEHTSELQSHSDLVCRLLLEKKKTNLLDQVQYRCSMKARSNTYASITSASHP